MEPRATYPNTMEIFYEKIAQYNQVRNTTYTI